ncbi:hypothetical protein [Alkalitalea saponilacus]|nr:hypothetical protein [Alkalitalea saponilacus]
MRGTITVGGLAIFYLWYQIYSNKLRIRELLPLFYSILIISSIYGLHYISKGWIIHNINSDNWTSSSKFAPFPLVIKNIIVFFWQLADYGRIILWAICGFTFLKQLKTRSSVDNKTAILMVLIISQTIIWFPITVAYQNAFGHRYFLPIIVLLPYLTLLVIRSYLNQKKILTAICIIALIGGYFIVYPKKTAQGWDATPAHWPYYSLRKEMINYIDDQSIDKNSISSFFPNLASSYNIDLDTENTFKFNQFDKEKSQYVFYSNVYNMSDEAIDLLFYSNSFSKKHVIKKGQIYVILFERDLEPGTTPPEP